MFGFDSNGLDPIGSVFHRCTHDHSVVTATIGCCTCETCLGDALIYRGWHGLVCSHHVTSIMEKSPVPSLPSCSSAHVCLCVVLGAISAAMKMHRTRVYTYCLCISAICSKLDGHGVEHAHLSCHLLHASHCTLLVCICKLHHQAWRGSLQDRRQRETDKVISLIYGWLMQSVHLTQIL